jgi:hypothetical protein
MHRFKPAASADIRAASADIRAASAEIRADVAPSRNFCSMFSDLRVFDVFYGV